MIEVQNLTKRYGESVAVDDLSFTVAPGRVTGFLGPNGSGKSTTMRAIVGLDRPTAGTVRVNGRRYASYPAPLQEVGALLDAKNVHPGRSAYDHLLYLANPTASASAGWPRCCSSSGWRRSPASGPRRTRSAWGSGWESQQRCWATRRP